MVDPETVKIAGYSVIGVVAGLKRNFNGKPPDLPAELEHYFESPPKARDWCSLPEYLNLLDGLLTALAPADKRLALCGRFGTLAAKRDLGATDPNQAPEVTAAAKEFTVSFNRAMGIPVAVRRCLSMRERYYNRGYYKVTRPSSHELEIALLEFPAILELCCISEGYLGELIQTANVGGRLRLATCKGRGDDSCTWRVRFDPRADVSSLGVFG